MIDQNAEPGCQVEEIDMQLFNRIGQAVTMLCHKLMPEADHLEAMTMALAIKEVGDQMLEAVKKQFGVQEIEVIKPPELDQQC